MGVLRMACPRRSTGFCPAKRRFKLGFGRCSAFSAPTFAAEPISEVPPRSARPGRELEHRLRGHSTEPERPSKSEHGASFSRPQIQLHELRTIRARPPSSASCREPHYPYPTAPACPPGRPTKAGAAPDVWPSCAKFGPGSTHFGQTLQRHSQVLPEFARSRPIGTTSRLFPQKTNEELVRHVFCMFLPKSRWGGVVNDVCLAYLLHISPPAGILIFGYDVLYFPCSAISYDPHRGMDFKRPPSFPADAKVQDRTRAWTCTFAPRALWTAPVKMCAGQNFSHESAA